MSALEFVGCESCRMTLAEYESQPEDDRKIEFFDSETERAWMVEEGPSFAHENPARRLVELVHEIAMVRGSPIRCSGAGGLRLLDTESRQVRAMHPDELVFLDPERASVGAGSFLTVGTDAYPDVVLEVDVTRDTRRDKLKLYEEWGFPEVWVEVPPGYAPKRRSGLRSELRIYLLEGDRYALSEESRAFPGWRASEIHRSLNEEVVSPETVQVLVRVGRALGEREGTGPEDDPMLGALGRRKYSEGRAEGRADGRAALVRALLGARGIHVSADFPSTAQRRALAAVSDEAVVSAATGAESEADFFARLAG